MNINELIKCMTDTLNRLYICRNNSSGIVRTNIYNAILYYKKMLIKNDCIFAYNDNSEVKLDKKSLYDTLFSTASDIQYFNSLFNEDNLINQTNEYKKEVILKNHLVKIIHGKGNYILKEEIHKYLKNNKKVIARRNRLVYEHKSVF